jgi:hypothetical protein
MFTDRFTFNTASTGNGGEGTYTIINEDFNKIKSSQNLKSLNFVYKKSINISFHKTFGIIKQYIGLGDVIEFITKYTGIKYIIVKITKGNCGCEKRRIKFNSLIAIPYFLLYIKNTNINDYYNKKIFTSKNLKSSEMKPLSDEQLSKLGQTINTGCGCGAKNKKT